MLEDGVVVPVGSDKATVVDVRFISATNHDLVGLVEEKKFRQDLYFRIRGVSIVAPALRDRGEDIPGLEDLYRTNNPLELVENFKRDLGKA